MTVNTDLAEQLLFVLRSTAAEPGLAYDRRPEPMHGGFWAELCSFSLAEPPDGWPKELVARLMPDPGAARKETIVQSAVASAGFPTPMVRASGGPEDGLGRAFMIMDRGPGGPLLAGLDGAGAVTSGLGLLRRVKEQRADLPVIMVTAYGDDERRRKAREFGASEFVTKPVDFHVEYLGQGPSMQEGKTVVALYALLRAVESGAQAASDSPMAKRSARARG